MLTVFLFGEQLNFSLLMIVTIKTSKVPYFATANNTCGSCSHLFSASTLLVFLCGLASIKMASAHRIPAAGHSCIATSKNKIK